MRTRILLIFVLIGLALVWLGIKQTDRYITIVGIILFIIGLIGAYKSFINKQNMGFLKRL